MAPPPLAFSKVAGVGFRLVTYGRGWGGAAIWENSGMDGTTLQEGMILHYGLIDKIRCRSISATVSNRNPKNSWQHGRIVGAEGGTAATSEDNDRTDRRGHPHRETVIDGRGTGCRGSHTNAWEEGQS